MACLPSGNDEFASAKEIIGMRNIGHKILLSSGDSVSRVLPIGKINSNQYQISFGNALNFTPDSVIKIVRQAVTANQLPKDYIVNVIDNQSKQVVCGFAVLKTSKTNLLPCKGRKQPKARYTVTITFRKVSDGSVKKNYLVAAGGGLAALMLIFSGLRWNHQQKKTFVQSVNHDNTEMSNAVMIGRYAFHQNEQILMFENEEIKLSDKETQVLNLLAQQINIVVARYELQKIWEDDGVIVGRSLDVFISKLRKKLNGDAAVRLVNVHGKGYKLEVA